MRFDHVALAATDVSPCLRTLVTELGGTVISGGSPGAFRALQLRLGSAEDGMTIELLEPWDTAIDDFLVRFLERHGEGPHHLTFKTDDLMHEHDRLSEMGLRPVGLQNESEVWREFFLHPSQTPGTVIQIAQLMRPEPSMAERMIAPAPWSEPWWPDLARSEAAATLERVVMGAPDPAETCRFFRDVLGGVVEEATHTVSWGRDRVAVVPADTPSILRLDVSGVPSAQRVCGIDLVPVT